MSRLACALAMIAIAAAARAQTEAPVVPGDVWQRVAPTEAGFSEARLDAVRAWLRTQRTTGLLVVANGRVVLEYGDVAHVSKVASVRKSILALLYGRYVDSGEIDLDRTVVDIGLEDSTPFRPLERGATLRHVLMARSGIYLPSGTPSLDPLLPARESHSPGTFFQYSNWDLNAAGAAFEKLTGRDIYEALETDLARPLGFQDFARERQEKLDMAPASRFPEYAMYLSARDMARIGLLMLRRGNWNGTHVVSANWIDEITTLVTPEEDIEPVVAGPAFANRWGYGMLWWVWDAPNVRGAVTGPYQGAYSAMGAYGQYVTVLPVLDLVVAHQVAFDEADERQGKPIAEVYPWEYDALLAMLVAAVGE